MPEDLIVKRLLTIVNSGYQDLPIVQTVTDNIKALTARVQLTAERAQVLLRTLAELLVYRIGAHRTLRCIRDACEVPMRKHQEERRLLLRNRHVARNIEPATSCPLLAVALCSGHLDLVRTLLAEDPHRCNGLTPFGFPIWITAYLGDMSAFDLLTEAGASWNCRDREASVGFLWDYVGRRERMGQYWCLGE